ncbi:pentapeptide repeat-containing protein [Dictyobacter arantiisoli]|uniref:Pentapeptide repeat protein n=1 Tax=Dictyobacter arantiisoli TaxID=2014874 RepID=A0A5A5TKA2_9CHLR|nr:pentapeptide repeat-containing protein [Dictyobacter arantiisoli]GCF11702.1 hypothetical protein KDI_52660 [Dictyobacter arantiisoli]
MPDNKAAREKVVVRSPRLPKRWEAKDIEGGYVQYHERYVSLALSGNDFTNQVAVRPAFAESSFQQVCLINTEFEELQLDDVRFTNCDLATANWYKSAWHRVELVGCRLTGFLAGEATLQDVLFKDCLISLAQFRFATLKSVRFEHCDLHDTDLLEADLTDVRFEHCNLQQAEFSGTRLAGVDLTTCSIDGARMGAKELQQATVNLTQAIALVESLGIHVRSSPEM